MSKIMFFRVGKPCYRSGWGSRKHAAFRHSLPCLTEAEWGESRLKAERAWLLYRRERRAKPETEPLLARWDKSGVLSTHSAGALHTVFSTPSLILCIYPGFVGAFIKRSKDDEP